MQTLLNIASGSNILSEHCIFGSAEKFEVWSIDKKFDVGAKLHAQALEADATKSLRFATGNADVVLSVSPFGFPLINTETMRVLKQGGGIIVLGSRKNPWIERDIAQSKDLLDKLTQLSPGDEPLWDQIARFLSDEKNYVSKISDGTRKTLVDTVHIWRKN